MLPLFLSTGDENLAWAVGVAWCFVHAIVAFIGAFVGPTLRRVTPRAAMLGTLAGVAITFIAMGPAFQVWQVAWIGMVTLGILFLGWLAGVEFPFKIPAGLLAVIVGVILGWATGYMEVAPLQTAIASIGLYLPWPQLQPLIRGLPLVGPYLITAIPLAIYLFLESLNNVESAFAEGDNYDTRGYALFGALCSFFGVIHAQAFGFNQALGPTIGYLAIAATCLGMMYYKPTQAVEPVAAVEASPGD